MTKEVMEWVERQIQKHGLRNKSVLDVGSLDVNGTVRPLFKGSYTGMDLRDGPNVDAVGDIEDKWETRGARLFEVVVSTEMLEHTPRPWLAVRGMVNFLAPGGPLLLTTRGFGFGRHDYPGDYYRFSTEAIEVLMAEADLDDIEAEEDPAHPGVFAIGWNR